MTLFEKYEAAKAAAESAASAAKQAAAYLAAERTALTDMDAKIEAIAEKRQVEIDRRAAIAADGGKVPSTALPSAAKAEDQRDGQVAMLASLEVNVSELQAEQKATAEELLKIWREAQMKFAAPLWPGSRPIHPMSLRDVTLQELVFSWKAMRGAGFSWDFSAYLDRLFLHRVDLTAEQNDEFNARVFEHARTVIVDEPEAEVAA